MKDEMIDAAPYKGTESTRACDVRGSRLGLTPSDLGVTFASLLATVMQGIRHSQVFLVTIAPIMIDTMQFSSNDIAGRGELPSRAVF